MAFVDQTMHIHIYDMEKNSLLPVDQDLTLFEGGLRNWKPSWSSDSRWLAYSKSMGNGNGAIFMYNVETQVSTQATSGFYSDLNPTFDPDGKYLYLTTNRSFTPIYSDFDNSWSYPNATQLAVVTLQADIASPLSPENDTVAIKIEDKKEEIEDEDKKKEDEKVADKKEEKLKIDFENFERRLLVLPPEAGNLGRLAAVSGKLVFQRFPNSGSSGGKSSLKYFDFKERKEQDHTQ